MKVNSWGLAILVAVVVAGVVEVGWAVTCSPMQMSPCVGAIISSSPPSALCCSKIKEQKPCLCGYLKNPSLRSFVDSPNARRVASDCGTPFPTC
ncbi:non-specific lipid-transfer protein 2 [Momordica charantia]|uniref:Non-specific lipid-transfer protein 2 n=1 Tax=Momordica charantia TaxID=3673 RepID=A0A6J1C151_MOMCH|nr:non-specific lipid-transfer protein 2 [Momordica charantia]